MGALLGIAEAILPLWSTPSPVGCSDDRRMAGDRTSIWLPVRTRDRIDEIRGESDRLAEGPVWLTLEVALDELEDSQGD